MNKRRKPGRGWRHLGSTVWEHESGVQIHCGGLVMVGNRWFYPSVYPHSVEWDRHTAIAGGNRKRGLMTFTLEYAEQQKGTAR